MQSNPVASRDNFTGSMFMLAAMASFALGDTVMKLASVELPLAQILVIRGLFAVSILFVLTYSLGQLRHIQTLAHPALGHPALGLRIVGELVATYFFLTALFNMPIANVTAILQILPLTVTLGAAVFFGEPIGWRRMAAILTGFFGVLLIVKPGLDGFNIYAVYTLVAVLGATLRDLATRKLPRELPSMLVALLSATFVLLGAIVLSAFQSWQPTSTSQVATLALASIFLVAGFFTIVSAMRIGEIAMVTPMRYSVVIYTLVIGMVVFGEFPDRMTIVGTIIVVASGLYTLYRERIQSRMPDVSQPAKTS